MNRRRSTTTLTAAIAMAFLVLLIATPVLANDSPPQNNGGFPPFTSPAKHKVTPTPAPDSHKQQGTPTPAPDPRKPQGTPTATAQAPKAVVATAQVVKDTPTATPTVQTASPQPAAAPVAPAIQPAPVAQASSQAPGLILPPQPTPMPTPIPTATAQPTPMPTATAQAAKPQPTPASTAQPTQQPTPRPTAKPQPTKQATPQPSAPPAVQPTPLPTEELTPVPVEQTPIPFPTVQAEPQPVEQVPVPVPPDPAQPAAPTDTAQPPLPPLPLPPGTPQNLPPVQPSQPGMPTLQRLEPVTDQAFGQSDQYVPNSWGAQKNRIVSTSSGDIFTVFISAGSDHHNHTFHLMHRPPNGGWEEVLTGNAGAEPVNILRGPHDEIHLFTWPGTAGILTHWVSTDEGRTFSNENIPGQWKAEQGYSGSGINDKGDIVISQSGEDQPGAFQWAYYSPLTNQWQFHISTFDYRYTYAYFFPGENNDLTIVGMRDVQRQTLGYAAAGGFNYIFNAIKFFYISDVNNPQLTERVVTQVEPQGNNDADVTYLTDSYIDTQGRTHILYNNLYDGRDILHHIIVANGQVVKDVQQHISYALKARITQDTQGHFYITTMDTSGQSLNIYPAAASDTDGTDMGGPVKLNIAQYPGCTDDDFCHSPTFTVPRNGHPLADEIDGVYGNFSKEIYFRIKLR